MQIFAGNGLNVDEYVRKAYKHAYSDCVEVGPVACLPEPPDPNELYPRQSSRQAFIFNFLWTTTCLASWVLQFVFHLFLKIYADDFFLPPQCWTIIWGFLSVLRKWMFSQKILPLYFGILVCVSEFMLIFIMLLRLEIHSISLVPCLQGFTFGDPLSWVTLGASCVLNLVWLDSKGGTMVGSYYSSCCSYPWYGCDFFTNISFFVYDFSGWHFNITIFFLL